MKKKRRRIILIALVVFILAITGYGAYSIYQIRNPETLFKKSNLKQNNNKEITNGNDQTGQTTGTSEKK